MGINQLEMQMLVDNVREIAVQLRHIRIALEKLAQVVNEELIKI